MYSLAAVFIPGSSRSVQADIAKLYIPAGRSVGNYILCDIH